MTGREEERRSAVRQVASHTPSPASVGSFAYQQGGDTPKQSLGLLFRLATGRNSRTIVDATADGVRRELARLWPAPVRQQPLAVVLILITGLEQVVPAFLVRNGQPL